MKDFSFVTASHPAYIEDLYNRFLENPEQVEPEYKKFFEGFDYAFARNGEKKEKNTAVNFDNLRLIKEFSVFKLIRAYRKRGHLISDTNPIRQRKDRSANLDLKYFGLSDADLDTEFEAGSFLNIGKTTLRNILERLKKIYCTTVGIEYTYINNEEICKWVETEFEKTMTEELPDSKKHRIMEMLNQSVIFEKFLHKKFIGQKRFSLEGGESTIAGLDAIIRDASTTNVKEVVIGMAHRGRLNVLANILHKTYEQIFNEFEGTIPEDSTMGSGDVKYHLGYRSNVPTENGGMMNVRICPNPSHLESVNPVVTGYARAKADIMYNSLYDSILPILIHGDASIAGQGIIYEVLQMSGLKGYYVGGTLHFVINNQIGFTTDFDDARTADYCTSIAAMTQAPVFHVNGDDPEAVVRVCELAFRFRQKFNKDVFVDMVCYRKWGHNEGDDPKFTQPALYNIIDRHKDPRAIYVQRLQERGEISAQRAKELEEKYWNQLQERLDEVKQKPTLYKRQESEEVWASMQTAVEADFDQSPDTSVAEDVFIQVFNAIMEIPEGFKPLRKISKLLDEKKKLLEKDKKVDWATGELLAYGTLLYEGHPVRMSGQDVKRGTFSHRHAILQDEETNANYNRLGHISENQGAFRIYNSLLSEFAVLGFEFGYAYADPNTLTIWEAQFGDFFNGAQTIIDQYITSSETKWGMNNGLVLLLPHGYEGQGPEHSSARMERFLQSCAELNMIITNCTTAANFFHLLRRQLKYPFRKPLVNFSPKANLRLDKAYSHISEFTQGAFREVIDDGSISNPAGVKRVIFCSGKIYFDLLAKQEESQRTDIAVVRIEQLYPFPHKQFNIICKKYSGAQLLWVQEEPFNMGAVSYLKSLFDCSHNIGYLARQKSASTATGYMKQHISEQEAIVEQAFTL